jgi:hypothetical protein
MQRWLRVGLTLTAVCSLAWVSCFVLTAPALVSFQGLGRTDPWMVFKEWGGDLSLRYMVIWTVAGFIAAVLVMPRRPWVSVAAFSLGGAISAWSAAAWLALVFMRGREVLAGAALVLAFVVPALCGGVALMTGARHKSGAGPRPVAAS